MTENRLTIYNEMQPRKSADEKYCHACGRIVNINAVHCVGCGAPQSQGMTDLSAKVVQVDRPVAGVSHNQIYCHGCGSVMHLSAQHCPKCGAQNTASTKKGSKDRITAGLFALLLGAFGAHHFYLGNIFLGLLYLIFFWTFIPMIIGFIEGIVYLTQSDETFARKYPL